MVSPVLLEKIGRADRRRVEPRPRPDLVIESITRTVETFSSNNVQRTVRMSLPRVRWMEQAL